MARTKNPSHYPTEYARIARQVGIEGKSWEAVVPDRHTGNRLRGHWYAYIGAVRTAAKKALQMPAELHSAEDLEYIVLARAIDRVWCGLEAIGSTGEFKLSFQNRDQSWQAQLLRKATVTQGPTPSLPFGEERDMTPAAIAERLREKGVAMPADSESLGSNQPDDPPKKSHGYY